MSSLIETMDMNESEQSLTTQLARLRNPVNFLYSPLKIGKLNLFIFIYFSKHSQI